MGTSSWGAEVGVVVDGVWFGEGPRWHDGHLWFSDIHGHRVLRVDVEAPSPELEVVVEVPDDEPSGLGWLPDGRLLITTMVGRRVLRVEPDGALAVHADLAGLARGVLNDMVVSTGGVAYVGDMGFDVHAPEAGMQPGQLLRVDPDGTTSVAADDLRAPNGPALTEDGSTLVIAESAGFALTAFTVAADGSLTDRRVHAEVPAAPDSGGIAPPDGICLDAEGAAWVADPIGRRVVRLLPGGELTHWIDYPGEVPVACVLGGADRRTLFVCVGPFWKRDEVVGAGAPRARIDAVEVEVPGQGRP